MTRFDTYPPGVPCFVDALTDDLAAARTFYAGIFDWEFAGPGPMPSGPDHEYWLARARGHDVAGLGSRPDPATPATWSTHVSVQSADDSAAAVQDAGGTVLTGPFDAPPAGRMSVVADPAGAVFVLWEAGTRAGAQIVNEPSAWAMSLLATPDPGAVFGFYEEVFGWRAEAFADAGPGVWLFRLPGYVGGEAEQPVPRDVVAAAMAAPDGPVGWSVDFWIADADAAAAAAPGLGGTVIEGPLDAPPFRRVILAAPDGAVFSVSELQLSQL